MIKFHVSGMDTDPRSDRARAPAVAFGEAQGRRERTSRGVMPLLDDIEKRVVTVCERAMTRTVNDIEHMESESYVVLLSGAAKYLFTPIAMAVVLAMLASYFLTRTLVPKDDALPASSGSGALPT
ncbi:MAG: hypothetical protein WB676_26735 [Bryobacteraceae bacterium]